MQVVLERGARQEKTVGSAEFTDNLRELRTERERESVSGKEQRQGGGR